jgi:hypothetical protein
MEKEMGREFATATRRIRLTFREADEVDHADEPFRGDLSAAAVSGRCLWTTNDEFAGVERLITADGTSYGKHRAFPLGKLFDLPEDQDDEMDIEGLHVDGGYLWMVGSHSLTRKKPKPHEKDPAEALERLSGVKFHANRHFLGRVPLALEAEGVHAPAAEVEIEGASRRAACLRMKKKGGKLAALLEDDEHIGRFMEIPAKENGFDIEGVAARGDRVFLGLRGPVLRGWALLVEIEAKETKAGRLKPRKLSGIGKRYAKHFLDLDGLGIRELAFDGDALLILAGPTMDLDGPVVLYRWPGCLDDQERMVITADRLELVAHIPHGEGTDHAEGMCWIEGPSGERELMMIYDSPAEDRLHDDARSIDADVFSFDEGGGRKNRTARGSRRKTR